MILVDTSIWVDHLRVGNQDLKYMLENGRVLTHPFILGELALRSLQQRAIILDALHGLPKAKVAEDNEVLRFIEQNRLYGIGIGYVDTHLLAAVRLSPGASLWTLDKRLLVAANQLGLCANLLH